MILEILTGYVVSSLLDKHKDKLPARVVKLITTDTSFQNLIEKDILPKSLQAFALANPDIIADEKRFEDIIAPALAGVIYRTVSSGKLDTIENQQAIFDKLLSSDLPASERFYLRDVLTSYMDFYREELAVHQDPGTALIMQALSQIYDVLSDIKNAQIDILPPSPSDLLAKTTDTIFISYSRANTDFAVMLENKLKELGFTVKRDRTNLRGGEAWWQQLKELIEESHYMVLCMSPEAIKSKYVADEWHHARSSGTAVIPVFATDVDMETVPRWMTRYHWYDFREEANEASIQWRSFINQLNTMLIPRKVTFMVDDLPEDYIPRLDELEPLIEALIDDQKNPVAITAAIQGAGGYGKTTLARAICHDNRVRATFDDGIFWVQLKENLSDQDIINIVLDLVYKINGSRPNVKTLAMAKDELHTALKDRYILMVIDDVWHAKHLAPFLKDDDNCGRLITTRIADSVPSHAIKQDLDAMTLEQSIQLLQKDLNFENEEDIETLHNLAIRLGKWALLLKIAKGILRKRAELTDPTKALEWLNQGLQTYGFQKLTDPQSETERNRAAHASISVSINLLDEHQQTLFQQLAIFPEDLDIPIIILQKLWELDAWEADEFCQILKSQSLLLDYIPETSIRLHDVVRQVLIDANQAHLPTWHEILLSRYQVAEWHQLPHDEPYIWQNLAYHLQEAKQHDQLHHLLCGSQDWMLNKFIATEGNNSYVADIELALAQYRDPLLPQELIRTIELWTARQVVNAEVAIYTDMILEVFVKLGRVNEALSHARLRTNAQAQFEGLWRIYRVMPANDVMKAQLFSEIMKTVSAIEDAYRKTNALIKIASQVAHTDTQQALSIAHSIKSTYRKANVLSSIVPQVAQTDSQLALSIVDEALSIAHSIEDTSSKAFALSSIASQVAQTDSQLALSIVDEALSIAHSIEDAYDKAYIMSII
ncbi:MAG: TIR domain-containing protein, partial [Chloroflexota bacterium]